jgi:hypothetical protein
VVFFEKPFIKFERLLLSSMQTFPRSRGVFREAMITWLSDKLWIKHLIQKKLGVHAENRCFAKRRTKKRTGGVGEMVLAEKDLGCGDVGALSHSDARRRPFAHAVPPAMHNLLRPVSL